MVARLTYSNTSLPCHFFRADLARLSRLSVHSACTYNEGPGEVREWSWRCPKFTDCTRPSSTCFSANQLPFLSKINACPTPTSHQTPFCLVPSRNLQSYFCASPTARPFVFLGLLPWLDLLFSTLDISNSEPFSLKVVKSHNFSTRSHFAS